MPSENVRIAAELIRAGRVPLAQQLLDEALRENPKDADAWLCMAATTPDPDFKRVCLENTVSNDPENLYARTALSRLARRPDWANTQVSNALRVGERQLIPVQAYPKSRPVHTIPTQSRSTSVAQRLGITHGELKIISALALVLFAVLSLTIFTIGSKFIAGVRQQEAEATAVAQEASAAATATAQAYECLTSFDDQMTSILSRFFRQEMIADTTSRINLPEQMARLEDIRGEAWAIPEKPCRPETHARLMDYMDKSITTFLSFSASDSDSVVNNLYIDSLIALAKLDDQAIADGHTGGLVPMFRERGYFYWEQLDDPSWKQGLSA